MDSTSTDPSTSRTAFQLCFSKTKTKKPFTSLSSQPNPTRIPNFIKFLSEINRKFLVHCRKICCDVILQHTLFHMYNKSAMKKKQLDVKLNSIWDMNCVLCSHSHNVYGEHLYSGNSIELKAFMLSHMRNGDTA